MARFRLMTTHYIMEQLLEPGTVVGDGTPWPVTVPSFGMEGEDEEGKRLCEEHRHNFNTPESAFPVQPNVPNRGIVRPGEAGTEVHTLPQNKSPDQQKSGTLSTPIENETNKPPIEGNMTSTHESKPPPEPAHKQQPPASQTQPPPIQPNPAPAKPVEPKK